MNYSIDNGFGDEISAGLSERDVRSVAQKYLCAHPEDTLTVYGDGKEYELTAADFEGVGRAK